MDKLYELWDIEAGNLIGTFETQAAALAIVHELIVLNGSEYAEALELGAQTSDDRFELVGTGAELRELAQTAAGKHDRVSSR